MKKWLVISVIFNLMIVVCIVFISLTWRGFIETVAQDFSQTHYQQKATMFESMPVRDSSFIFLGNSITEGANWAELFDNPNIINRGIGGDITEGVLMRINEIIRHQPLKLFIAIGTNDIGWKVPPAKIIENYLSIVENVRASSPNTKIYIQSILPVAIPSGSLLLHNNEGVLEVNQGLKKICKDLDITYLDLHSHFEDETGKLKSELTNDGLHLLGKGYLLWKDLIQDDVSE
ncbi:MAG: lysophospholipase L1-like esterase [Cryomorphaceae bacterium]|jgi:lysophospholipase L1-like esterase